MGQGIGVQELKRISPNVTLVQIGKELAWNRFVIINDFSIVKIEKQLDIRELISSQLCCADDERGREHCNLHFFTLIIVVSLFPPSSKFQSEI